MILFFVLLALCHQHTQAMEQSISLDHSDPDTSISSSSSINRRIFAGATFLYLLNKPTNGYDHFYLHTTDKDELCRTLTQEKIDKAIVYCQKPYGQTEGKAVDNKNALILCSTALAKTYRAKADAIYTKDSRKKLLYSFSIGGLTALALGTSYCTYRSMLSSSSSNSTNARYGFGLASLFGTISALYTLKRTWCSLKNIQYYNKAVAQPYEDRYRLFNLSHEWVTKEKDSYE